ncbi:ricin B lectin domain-containing protein [Aspergillus sergii]|uniref:Ricin B lectin domain-containing protein n=1 Tax=Aspergillus sergii TaxID=1034303 RepID=A0A5N6XNY2_9EURO|nr:ricin B lectin domain-containing protein [Aspergillus sergii]
MSDYTGPGNYKIWSRHSGKVLDIGNGYNDGDILRIMTESSASPRTVHQLFTITAVGGDEFLILHFQASLLICPTSKKIHESVHGYRACPQKEGTRWKIIPAHDGSGSYYIENAALPGQVLDVSGGQNADGTPIVLRDKNGSANQQFFIRLP